MNSPNIHEFTSDNFAQEVVLHNGPVMVEFGAPWCQSHNKSWRHIADCVADQFVGKVKVGKVNVDENPDLATEYGLVSIPWTMIFKGGGTPFYSFRGLVSEAKLAEVLNEVLAD